MAKAFKFVNDAAKRAYKALPREIQRQFGIDLDAVQQGKDPFSEFKNIAASVGPGAIELIKNGSPGYRAVYCVKHLDTVFILHAFTKTTNGVDQANMDTAKDRYKVMMEQVRAAEKAAKKSAAAAKAKKKK